MKWSWKEYFISLAQVVAVMAVVIGTIAWMFAVFGTAAFFVIVFMIAACLIAGIVTTEKHLRKDK